MSVEFGLSLRHVTVLRLPVGRHAGVMIQKCMTNSTHFLSIIANVMLLLDQNKFKAVAKLLIFTQTGDQDKVS